VCELLRRHIAPYFAGVTLGMIDNRPARIRAWRAELLSAGVSVSDSAKAYRLLRAVLHTAVDDDVIRRNPEGCTLPVGSLSSEDADLA
jgi:hypothetical protein